MLRDVTQFSECRKVDFPALKERLEQEGYAVFEPISISKKMFNVTYMLLEAPKASGIFSHECTLKEFSWFYNVITEEDGTVFDIEVVDKVIKFKYLRNCDRHLMKKS